MRPPKCGNNVVQKYESRTPEVEHVCLADFVSKYRYDTRNKRYVLRDRPVVIRYRHYTQDTPDDYKREQVLLYVPFRNEAVDVLDNNNYNRLYDENKDIIAAKQHEYSRGNDGELICELAQMI